MAKKPNVNELVKQMPWVDQPKDKPEVFTAKFTGPPPAEAEEVYTAIFSGGRDSIVELIGMMRDHSDPEFKDFRPEYVLHGMAILAGRNRNRKLRAILADTLVSQLGNDGIPAAVKGFLIRELQVVGGRESVKALGKFLDDEALCESAAQALVAIGGGATRELRGAMRDAKGKCRVTIVQNLGVVRDKRSVGALRKAVEEVETDTRLAAVWALARLGDAKSADLLLKAADAEPGWERIQATKACLVLAENLLADGKKAGARKIYESLRDSRTDPSEAYVREVADKALEAI